MCLKKLQSFAGLINYYQQYIPKHAEDMGPLFKLLKKRVNFTQGIEQQKAFNKIKDKISKTLVLIIYNLKLLATIKIDILDFIIGAELS